jgi:membrane protein
MASKRFFRLIKIFSGATANAEDEIIQLEGRAERFVHFWMLAIRQFIRNRCFIRASALAYTSLLAMIPLLAVAVSVTSSLLKTQGEDKIYEAIDKLVSNIMPPASVSKDSHGATLHLNPITAIPLMPTNRPAGTNWSLTGADAPKTTNISLSVTATDTNGNVLAFLSSTNNAPEDHRVVTAQKEAAKGIHDFIQNTQSGTLGVTGMIMLVFVAIMMLSRVEETFNDIWGVARGRSWLWRIVLYWATITLGPLLLIAALGLAGNAHFQAAKSLVSDSNRVGNFLMEMLPVVVLWFTFALVYQLVPNTKVRFSAALAGGVVAGSLWHLNNVFGFLYVSRVVTNSKIYGSIGLVPVFMLGLYFSWVILLFGAQVAYAFQNRSAYLQNRLADNVNQRGREFVALRLMTCLGQRFQNHLRPATILQLSAELGIPSPLTQSVLRILCGKRLVTEVAGAETAFVPARPLETINAYDILLAMRTGNGQELPLREESALGEIYGEFTRIEQAERQAATSISLLTLAQRMPVTAALPEAKTIRSVRQAADVEIIAGPKKFARPAAPETAEATISSVPPHHQPAAAEAKPEPARPFENTIARRDVVMPEENREFPL